MKIKFYKRENNFKKESFILSTKLCWEVAVLGTFTIMVISCLFSYRLFVSINRESVPSYLKAGEKVPTVDQSRIEKALLYFSEKENKSAHILNSGSLLADPSQ